MAASLVPYTRTLANGRTLYFSKTGRFISERQYNNELRRGPDGRYISKEAAARRLPPGKIEAALRKELGAPPAGKTWSQLAQRYTEKFADYLADIS